MSTFTETEKNSKIKHLFLGVSQTVAAINKPTISNFDEVRPFREGQAAVRKGYQSGYINKEGQLIIALRNDIVWSQEALDARGVAGKLYPQFYEGLCII